MPRCPSHPTRRQRYLQGKSYTPSRKSRSAIQLPGQRKAAVNDRSVDLDSWRIGLGLPDLAFEDLKARRKSIDDVQPEQICEEGELPAAIYVGAIVGRSDASKGVALQVARSVVNRLVKSFGMRPVHPHTDDPIGALHMNKVSDVTSPGRARRTRE